MRLINYFVDELDGKRPSPKHLRLLKAYYERQLRMDAFIGDTRFDTFMREKPKYHKTSQPWNVSKFRKEQ